MPVYRIDARRGEVRDLALSIASRGVTIDEIAAWFKWRAKRGSKLFGAEKIPGEVGLFLGYFMIRKVIGPREAFAAAGPTTCLTPSSGQQPRARICPTQSAWQARCMSSPERSTLDTDGLVDDYLTISNVEPGMLWFEGGIGPVEVGHAVSRLAKPGWSVNIVLGRQPGRWQVMEVGNVYPNQCVIRRNTPWYNCQRDRGT